MKLERHIAGFFFALRKLSDRLTRARFFRGHGVHSPFVYTLVREVFMQERLLGADRSLYDRLLAEGVAPRRAVQLQNLFTHSCFRSWAIDAPADDLIVLTPRLSEERTRLLTDCAADGGTTLALLAPYENRSREALCRSIVAAHGSTSVDNRAYLLVFNHDLPKQHFRI